MSQSGTAASKPAGHDIAMMTAKLDSFEPESMEAALSNTSVEHLQLSSGRFQAEVMHARFTASSLDWGSYNLPLYAAAEMPSDRITLGYILAGDGESMMNGKAFSSPTAAVFTEGTELDYRLAPDTQWMGLQIERSQIERMGLTLQQNFAGPVRHLSPDSPRHTWNLLDTLDVLRKIPDSGVPDPIACMKQAEACLFDILSAALPSEQSRAIRRSQDRREATRLVRLASDYIHAHITEPMRIGTLCFEIDCDLKSLERAFHTVHGMAPRQYLTLLRLNRARKLLLGNNGSDNVTDIAMACGITHLGRFSQQYRSWFGESPSTTLARSTQSAKAH